MCSVPWSSSRRASAPAACRSGPLTGRASTRSGSRSRRSRSHTRWASRVRRARGLQRPAVRSCSSSAPSVASPDPGKSASVARITCIGCWEGSAASRPSTLVAGRTSQRYACSGPTARPWALSPEREATPCSGWQRRRAHGASSPRTTQAQSASASSATGWAPGWGGRGAGGLSASSERCSRRPGPLQRLRTASAGTGRHPPAAAGPGAPGHRGAQPARGTATGAPVPGGRETPGVPPAGAAEAGAPATRHSPTAPGRGPAGPRLEVLRAVVGGSPLPPPRGAPAQTRGCTLARARAGARALVCLGSREAAGNLLGGTSRRARRASGGDTGNDTTDPLARRLGDVRRVSAGAIGMGGTCAHEHRCWRVDSLQSHVHGPTKRTSAVLSPTSHVDS
mmetsp:Transcript_39401/g.121608  ORF Transcript_39401/g.121608 Transcript_39401/m.121608 type:complete len:394 (+) Transcript_39401:1255-2436(+)